MKRFSARLPKGCLVLLLACVVCAQALVFMHNVLHGQPVTAPPGIGAHHLSEDHADTGLAALFATHEEADDCRLLDALGQFGPVLRPLLLLPPVAPDVRQERLRAGACLARWAALFDARGPPPSR